MAISANFKLNPSFCFFIHQNEYPFCSEFCKDVQIDVQIVDESNASLVLEEVYYEQVYLIALIKVFHFIELVVNPLAQLKNSYQVTLGIVMEIR
ncbi:hypothetical protein [Bacillus sp. 2205SS5-2]|uniref:hypothetical protein n=1 Tax=Bacillus sp. 2205SS5-2 TaxID=3109031 RepID=UPI003006C49C